MIMGKKEKAYRDAYRYVAKKHDEDDIKLLHLDMWKKGLCVCPVCAIEEVKEK